MRNDRERTFMLGLRTYTMLFALAVGPANAAVVTYGSTTTNPAANNSGTYVDMRALWESLTTGEKTVDFNLVNLTPGFGAGFFSATSCRMESRRTCR